MQEQFICTYRELQFWSFKVSHMNWPIIQQKYISGIVALKTRKVAVTHFCLQELHRGHQPITIYYCSVNHQILMLFDLPQLINMMNL